MSSIFHTHISSIKFKQHQLSFPQFPQADPVRKNNTPKSYPNGSQNQGGERSESRETWCGKKKNAYAVLGRNISLGGGSQGDRLPDPSHGSKIQRCKWLSPEFPSSSSSFSSLISRYSEPTKITGSFFGLLLETALKWNEEGSRATRKKWDRSSRVEYPTNSRANRNSIYQNGAFWFPLIYCNLMQLILK